MKMGNMHKVTHTINHLLALEGFLRICVHCMYIHLVFVLYVQVTHIIRGVSHPTSAFIPESLPLKIRFWGEMHCGRLWR